MGTTSYPDKMARLSQAAEKAGFDSVWAGGHPFLSEKQSRIPANMRMLDPVVSLSFIAAHTRTIRLGTAILLISQLNPLLVAKETREFRRSFRWSFDLRYRRWLDRTRVRSAWGAVSRIEVRAQTII